MTDDPLSRGTAPGSLRHFAVTYAPATARPILHALYAFEAELDDTVRTASHEVAHTRVQWWRGEVDRLQAGHPQHPVTRAMLPLREWARADLPQLHEALVAADIDLARLALQNAAEVEAYCFRSAGSLQTLAAIACSHPRQASARERTFAGRLGSLIRRTEMLRDLRGLLSQGRLPLPIAALEEAGLDPQSLRPESWSTALSGLLESQRESLRREFDALPSSLDPGERPAQRQGLVLAALHAQLVRRIEHRGELARTRVEVPAWTRLWTARRTAVRYA
jgi:15-cis-phytoene synthase